MLRRSRDMNVQYAALAAGENGDAFDGHQYPDKSVQAIGTGTVTVQGSADLTNWVALKDNAGVAISLDATLNAISIIGPNPRYLRPVMAGGTALILFTCVR